MTPPLKRTRGRPRAFKPNPEQTSIRSLDRALVILKALAKGEGLSLTELAEATGQAPATVYRVLSTFEAHAVVEADPIRQLWFVGAEAFRIGSAFLSRTSLVERGRPILRELMIKTGETANLAIPEGGQVVFVSQVETHEPIRAFFRPGTRSSMHASGAGKAILAFFPVDQIETVLRTPLAAFTPKTLTNRERLKADLANSRIRGWAVDDEEHTAGMRCVAAAVFNQYGEPVGALSISGPIARITPHRDADLGITIRRAADHLTEMMGGRAPYGTKPNADAPDLAGRTKLASPNSVAP